MRTFEDSHLLLSETAAAEVMLALAEVVGVDLDAMERARRRLAHHEAQYDASFGAHRRNELAQLMAILIDELAAAYKLLAAGVERGGEA